jgi:hypothetical protein
MPRSAGFAKCQYRLDQGIDVARVRAVIDYCCANCELVSDHSRRRRSNSRFLKVNYNLAVETIWIMSSVTEANNAELHGS